MDRSSLKNKIKDKLWDHIKEYFYRQRVKDSPLIQNISFDDIDGQKRALVCYLPSSYFQTLDLKTLGRTIPLEIFKLVKILAEFGFSIDIIPANDLNALELVKSKRYDLIYGFGETFYQITLLQPNSLSIFYMTENHPEFSYREERKRLDYFYERHKKIVPIERSGRFYKISHLETKYDHVIALGEIDLLKKDYTTPFSIFPTGIFNPDFIFHAKDHSATRTHFLWLGSSAIIHKGLDLLIDVFKLRDDVTLHICGLDHQGRKILSIPEQRNIIDYGYVHVNSKKFLEIVDRCSYSILPSCSEGMATSITTSMLHGLVPVVIKNAGFNRLGEHAIFLDDFKIEYLDEEISKLRVFDPKRLEVMASKIFNFASRNFNLTSYEMSLRSIFQDIIK